MNANINTNNHTFVFANIEIEALWFVIVLSSKTL